jgi:hypothetical protein
MPQNSAEIEYYRTRVEASVRALLEKSKSNATLDDIKDYMFNQIHDTPPRIWLYDATKLFGLGPDPVEMDNAELMVLEDSWNYFPHRSLNGRSPAEIFLELS